MRVTTKIAVAAVAAATLVGITKAKSSSDTSCSLARPDGSTAGDPALS